MLKTLGWSAHRRFHRWGQRLLIGLALAIFLLPLTWTFAASLDLLPDDTASPPTWTWPPTIENYIEIGVAEPGFVQELITSTSVSFISTLLTILVSFLAAYSLARSRLRGSRLWVQGFLILASLPVMAYLIPLSDTLRHLHLQDTYIGVALANTAVSAPLAVYVLQGYLKQVPSDLEESARLDGATLWQILWRVILPSAAPGVAATAIIVFVLNWNLFLIPLVLTAGRVKTITVAMSDFFTFERELEWPTAAAALIVSLLPLVALVTMAHRIIERFTLHAEQESE